MAAIDLRSTWRFSLAAATDFGSIWGLMESSQLSPVDRPQVSRLPAAQRSRVTNGKELLPDIDGRSARARRFKDITAALVVDQGGADRLTEARFQLVRRFAAAAVIAEQLESHLANGEEIDVQQHALLCSSLVRLAQRIGINRRAKDITPALPDYLDAAEAEAEAEIAVS
jgi:hypothetical protein